MVGLPGNELTPTSVFYIKPYLYYWKRKVSNYNKIIYYYNFMGYKMAKEYNCFPRISKVLFETLLPPPLRWPQEKCKIF